MRTPSPGLQLHQAHPLCLAASLQLPGMLFAPLLQLCDTFPTHPCFMSSGNSDIFYAVPPSRSQTSKGTQAPRVVHCLFPFPSLKLFPQYSALCSCEANPSLFKVLLGESVVASPKNIWERQPRWDLTVQLPCETGAVPGCSWGLFCLPAPPCPPYALANSPGMTHRPSRCAFPSADCPLLKLNPPLASTWAR